MPISEPTLPLPRKREWAGPQSNATLVLGVLGAVPLAVLAPGTLCGHWLLPFGWVALLSILAPLACLLGSKERSSIRAGRSPIAGAQFVVAGTVLGIIGTGVLALLALLFVFLMVSGPIAGRP